MRRSATMDKKKLAQMIAMRISASQIAMSFGVSEARIVELVEGDEEVRDLIATFASVQATQDIKKEATLENIERNLIQKIDGLVEGSDSLTESTNALIKLADLRQKRTAIALMDKHEEGALKLDLQLSNIAHLQVNIMFSDSREIIDINGRNMGTMPATKLKSIIKEKADDLIGEAKQEALS